MRRRNTVTDLEPGRAALSLRGVEREFGLSRPFVAELVRTGELAGIRRGRAIKVLRSDVEAWWRRQAERERSRAQAVVDRVLEREARRAS